MSTTTWKHKNLIFFSKRKTKLNFDLYFDSCQSDEIIQVGGEASSSLRGSTSSWCMAVIRHAWTDISYQLCLVGIYHVIYPFKFSLFTTIVFFNVFYWQTWQACVNCVCARFRLSGMLHSVGLTQTWQTRLPWQQKWLFSQLLVW